MDAVHSLGKAWYSATAKIGAPGESKLQGFWEGGIPAVLENW